MCSLVHLFRGEAIKMAILCSILLCVAHGDVCCVAAHLLPQSIVREVSRISTAGT